MKGTARFVQFAAGLAGLMVAGWVLSGHAAGPAHPGIALPTDWSHRHLIFTRPGSAEVERRVSEDPRYWQQMYRREQSLAVTREVPEFERDRFGFPTRRRIHHANTKQAMHRDWSEDLGSGGLHIAGNYPAKFSFSTTTANCASATTPDFVVYSTGLPGITTTQADIVAFDNLYSGCTAPVPTVYWAFNTEGAVYTSPVISRDGTQIAFVQTNGGPASALVLLKWAAGSGTLSTPTHLNPNTTSNAAYRACTAPCDTTLNLTNTDSTSSVFYDYSNDIAWVGDSGGLLHKFTGVFSGTPAEAGSPWPVTVSSGPTALTSPVYDHASTNVFVEDVGGFVYSVNSSTGALTQSARLDQGTGFVEGPVVDSSNHLLYAFASSDGSGTCNVGTTNCTAVFLLSTAFTSGATGSKVVIGSSTTGETPAPTYIGAFDSAYYSSSNATGNLYVCGDTADNPALYQVPMTAGAFPISGQATVMDVLATATVGAPIPCSAVTDVPNPNGANGNVERVFVSTENKGQNSNCSSGGCIESFVTTPWQASTAYAVGQQVLSFVASSSNHLHVQTVMTAGTSGATAPVWISSASQTTTDGTVTWIDQGFITSSGYGSWAATTAFGGLLRIIDSNGNIQIVNNGGGTSGGSAPTWNTAPSGTTTDGTIQWINGGGVPVFALAATGGTTGIINDNVVAPGTQAGASQVYFATQGSQTCTTSGGSGVCAVQASQPALQ